MQSTRFVPRGIFVLALFAGGISLLKADTLSSFGDVQIVTDSNNNLAWQITSNASSGAGYGGLDIALPVNFTLGSLTSLSMVVGGGPDEAGSIRFYLQGPGNQDAFAYPGGETNTDPNAGAIASTPDFVNSTGLYWNTNSFGLGSSGSINFPFVDFATLLSDAGASTSLTDVGVVADSGYAGTEVFDVESITLNGTTYTPSAVPEPATLFGLGIGLVVFGVVRRVKHPSSRES